VSQVADVETKAERMSLYQGALTAGSVAQAEHGQHFLLGAPFCYRLSQHGVGPRSVASEMGAVEPEHGSATSYRPSGSAIGGI
jgi:hypothetical protein